VIRILILLEKKLNLNNFVKKILATAVLNKKMIYNNNNNNNSNNSNNNNSNNSYNSNNNKKFILTYKKMKIVKNNLLVKIPIITIKLEKV
jgi:hypothetical protein